MATLRQKIKPNLWFDRQAEEAAHFYSSVFKNSTVGRITRAGRAGPETTGLKEGTVMTVEFEVYGHQFVGINGGPIFKFTPAVSFLVACDSPEEVDVYWGKLSAGGSPLMELGKYPFSEQYGWIQDKYGVSWQVMFMGDRKIEQKITPTLMFVREQWGKAETAVNFYTSIFKNSKIGGVMRYSKGEAPEKEGTIRYEAFILENQAFAAMDSGQKHEFGFNEAISLMVECKTQKEIDYYWDNLTGSGGQEGVCGWLKDKFNVSWQITPTILGEMLGDPDKEKVARVTQSFLKMKKMNVAELNKAYQG